VSEPASLMQQVKGELSELTVRGPRARAALAAALAVGVAIVFALALRLQDVFWAGISAFVCMQASQPQSLRKGFHRILGTLLGAVAALIFFPPVAFDHFATLLLLFAAGSTAIAGSLVSRYSYAWLLGGITAVMVILGALDDPTQALNIAFFRSSEIVLGTSVALIIANWLLPPGPAIVASAPGWSSLFNPRSNVLDYAYRAGISIAIVPAVWRMLEVPNLSQMAISIGAVMAVPVLTSSDEENRRSVAHRALQRLMGCLVGGALGLFVLQTGWSASFPVWLLLLMIGAAVGVQFETGHHDVKIIGIQAEVALILTLTQGWGPASLLQPALDRVGGMVGAILLLWSVNLILGPVRGDRGLG
jgi:uncharacterized membrane protein YccC